MSLERPETFSTEDTGNGSVSASRKTSSEHDVAATAPIKRRDFSVSEKVELLMKYDALPRMSQSKAARELGISKQLVCRILQQRADIMEAWLHNKDTHRKRRRCGKDGEVEAALKEWFNRACAEGATVTGPIMRKKAEELARNLGKMDFVATDGWFSRWRKRENIVLFGRPRGEESETPDGQWADMLAVYSAECVYGAEDSGLRDPSSEAQASSSVSEGEIAANSTPDTHQRNSNSLLDTPTPPERGMQQCQTKRRDLSISEKLEVLAKYDAFPSMSQRDAASQLGVSQPLLSKILNSRQQIVQESLQNSTRKRKRCGKDGEVEIALKEWFDVNRNEGLILTGPMLRKKAEELARELGKDGFVATDGWFSRWRKRENITTGKTRALSESSFCTGPSSEDAFVPTEQDFYGKGYVNENHPVSDTNNLSDEATPLRPASPYAYDDNTDIDGKSIITSTTSDENNECYPNPENKTLPAYPPERIYSIEVSSVDYLSKPCFPEATDLDFPLQWLGVLCCVNLTGSKQKLLVVGQRDVPSLRNVCELPVDYYFHSEARVTPHIIFDWLMKWDRRLHHEIVLMMDDCQNLRAITSFQNLKFMPVPECLSSCGWSLTHSLRSRFGELKRQRLEWLRLNDCDGAVQSADSSLRSMGFLSLLHMIARSWHNVPSSCIRDRFVRCGLLAGSSSSNELFPSAPPSPINKSECCDESSSNLVVDQYEAAPPANEEVYKALSVLTRAVHHRAAEFGLQYQYEKFIHSLL